MVETAALGQQVVAADGVGVLVGDPSRAVGAARLLVGDGEVQQVALGAEAALHSERKTTAIDAVRLSMSTAPRPHTSPSISSPPNGSCRHPAGLTGTTSVWPIRHSDGAVGIGARDAGDERGATRRRLPPLDVDAGALDVGLQHVGVARLEPGLGGALVDALVADQRLQQLDRLTGQIRSHPPSLAPGRVRSTIASVVI